MVGSDKTTKESAHTRLVLLPHLWSMEGADKKVPGALV